MGQYTKAQALSILVECAKKYKANLLNCCLMLVYMDKGGSTDYLEVSFDASNFLHLTGVKTDISPTDFYRRCVNSRLRIDDFTMANDSTTELKLSVLPSLITPNLSANMIGDYTGTNVKLYTEKLAGSIKACMGFVATKPTGRYVPNTVLKIDIRDRVVSPYRIIATYRKSKDADTYTELVYKAKNIDWSKISYPAAICDIPKPIE